MADIECPQCGRSVLGVATRCPHCGEAFPSHLLQDPGSASRPRTTRAGLLLAGAGLLLGLALLTGRSGGGARVAPVPQTGTEDTLPSAPPSPASDSVPAPAADTAPIPPSAAVRSSPLSSAPGFRRYARTWVNVRTARSGAAPGIRILSPGDTVVVDSLRRGWYRVLLNGRPLGYVDRTYLDTLPLLGPP